MTTAYSGFEEVTPGQNQKELTINDAINQSDKSVHSRLVVDMTAGDVTLTAIQFQSNYILETANVAAANDSLILPESNLTQDIEKMAFVVNPGVLDITVETDNVAPATYTLPAGRAVLLHVKSNVLTVVLEVDAGGVAPSPRTYSIDFPFTPTATERLLTLVFAEDVNFLDLADSQGRTTVNPTVAQSLDVHKNGASVATINISTGGVFSFVVASAPLQFAPNDYMEVFADPVVDVTLDGIAFTLKGIV